MDYRKLIGFSNGSFVVTMPKYWVEKNKLKKGDNIGVEEGSDEIIFYAEGKSVKKEEKSITISMDGKKLSRVKAEIITAYLNNYHTIEIFSKTLEEDAPVLKGILRNLSGMEIIEQTRHRIVAKDLIDISSISINSIIRRVDLIARSMMDDNILCIDGKCNPDSIIHRDMDINRLYYLGFRVIKNIMDSPKNMKTLNTTSWNLLVNKIVLRRIEELADAQKRMSRLIVKAGFQGKLREEFKSINKELKERFCKVMKAYYSKNKQTAHDIEVTGKDIIDRCNKFLEDASKVPCHNCNVKKGAKKSIQESNNIVVSTANIVEQTKATSSFIKHIARDALNVD